MMSFRRTPCITPMPWTTWGCPIAFRCFCVGRKKSIAFGVGSAETQSWLRLRLSGLAFGGVLSLLSFLHDSGISRHSLSSSLIREYSPSLICINIFIRSYTCEHNSPQFLCASLQSWASLVGSML